MKKLLILVAVCVLVLGARVASVQAFNLGGYVGPLEIQMTGFSESDDDRFITGETWGVFKLTTINKNDGSILPNLWTADSSGGSSGEDIYGMFWGLVDQPFVALPGGSLTTIKQKFGKISLWLDADGQQGGGVDYDWTDITNRSAQDAFDTITDNHGLAFLTGDFVPGIIDGDAVTTVQQAIDLGSLEGTGDGFIDLTGGTHFDMFNSSSQRNFNSVGTLFNDLKFHFTASAQGAADLGADFDFRLTDPINAAVVPEPTTIALLGIGLVGMAGVAVRRKFGKKKDEVEKS